MSADGSCPKSREPEGRRQGLRQPIGAARDHAGGRGGRAHRRGGGERRWQVAADELDEGDSVREVLVGERAEHEWAADAAFRDVLDGLLGGVSVGLLAQGMDTPVAGGVGARPRGGCGGAAAAAGRPRACCSPPPSCSCWTSRPTTWTSKASTGWRATWPPDGAPCSWGPTTPGSWQI